MEIIFIKFFFVFSFALTFLHRERVIEEVMVTQLRQETSTQDLPIFQFSALSGDES